MTDPAMGPLARKEAGNQFCKARACYGLQLAWWQDLSVWCVGFQRLNGFSVSAVASLATAHLQLLNTNLQEGKWHEAAVEPLSLT